MKHLPATLALWFTSSALTGCFAAPEACVNCVLTAPELGSDGGAQMGGNAGTGMGAGTGGSSGTGGVIATGGGSGTGGVTSSGSGGANSSGGSGSGGAGTGTGGSGAGTGTGGSGSGGAGTGGSGSGNGSGSGSGGSVGSTGGSPPGSGGQGTGGAASGGSGGASSGGIDTDLVLWYKFDDGTGTAVVDSGLADGAAQNGALTTIGSGGSATFTSAKQVGTHAVSLSPASTAGNANGGYVTASSLHTLAPQAMTIALWVNLTENSAAQNWERIFDFGTGTGTTPNFYMTARASDGVNTPVRFAITNSGHSAQSEQRIDGSALLSPNAWHHVAVVLPAGSPYVGTLYIDGAAVGSNSSMTLHAADIGATTNNWLGRSQFSGTLGTNPTFNGVLDDFRVYRRALTAADISALFAVR